jgi:hypothetical protein
MQVGIEAYGGSIIDVLTFNTYFATDESTDVTISNSAGTSNNGVIVDTASTLNVSSARLVINRPGQTLFGGGGEEGGILLSDGSAMIASNGSLVIRNSHGQGIVAVNNSHATIVGASITGGSHGGLVATNLSSINVSSGGMTIVGGNSVDLFCDAGSIITGSVNLAGAPISQCANLLAGETVSLP